MVVKVDPKVNVVDYGPYLDLDARTPIRALFRRIVGMPRRIITPDEFVWGAAQVTYKDIGVLREMIEHRKKGRDLREAMKKSVIQNAGAGHASMATTPLLWVFLEGNSSKLVDSIFTGVRYGSSLMPSGRRVPVTEGAIVLPQDFPIKEGNSLTPENLTGNAERIYVESIRRNIQAYEKLQDRGVSKQEAAKIVPYGHKGGGFMVLSLETLASLSNEFQDNPDVPMEGKRIVAQLEDFVHSHGMEVTYEARKNAPRTGCPNPSIFHTRKNLPYSLARREGISLTDPTLISFDIVETPELEERVREYLKRREEVFSTPQKMREGWAKLLRDKEHLVADNNDGVSALTFILEPWRVWGEDKRHRALPQTAESIYHTVERARKYLFKAEEKTLTPEYVSNFFSVPQKVAEDNGNWNIWINRIQESFEVYDSLIKMGVDKSDAINVIPRGIKLGVTKRRDLYNMTTGHDSLRLCTTAEPEMRQITEKESALVTKALPDYMRGLIGPKCADVGFCPDRKNCGRVAQYLGFPNTQEIYDQMTKGREQGIRDAIGE